MQLGADVNKIDNKDLIFDLTVCYSKDKLGYVTSKIGLFNFGTT